MRVHVYSQELTDEVNLIGNGAGTGVVYHGVQFVKCRDVLVAEIDGTTRGYGQGVRAFRDAPPETWLD